MNDKLEQLQREETKRTKEYGALLEKQKEIVNESEKNLSSYENLKDPKKNSIEELKKTNVSLENKTALANNSQRKYLYKKLLEEKKNLEHIIKHNKYMMSYLHDMESMAKDNNRN